MSAPLEWVKLYTRIDTDGDWRRVPVTHRYVFLHLLVLGGLSPTRGQIRMDDGAIAAHMGVERRDVTAAVDRFVAAPWRSLSRSVGTVTIKNWPKFQDSSHREETREEEKRREKKRPAKVSFDGLPKDRKWWAARAAEHPGVNLLEELEKSQEWHGASKVKNVKLFFRNWLKKAPRTVAPSLTAEERRTQLGLVS